MIYMTGYSGWDHEVFLRYVRDNRRLVYDIRFAPYSRDERWTRSNLQRRLPGRYFHATGFGNKRYRDSGQVELSDPEPWLSRLQSHEQNGESIVLLCGCRDAARCHRTVVAALIKQRFGMSAIEISREDITFGHIPLLPFGDVKE